MKDNVQKIREEVEKLKSQLLRGACSSQIAMETMCKEEAYNEVLSILDSMKEEPVSIWHDTNHRPTMYRKYLVRYSDGRVNGSWERHDDGFISWKDVVKEHGFTHWCYTEDLLKL